MKITKFSIRNYKCIQDLSVDCRGEDGETRQWTVLLGENNTGKTNVLRALALLTPQKINFRTEADSEFNEARVPLGLLKTHGATVIAQIGGQEWGFAPGERAYASTPVDLHLYGYGVSRYPARTALSEREARPVRACWISKSGCCSWIIRRRAAARNRESGWKRCTTW